MVRIIETEKAICRITFPTLSEDERQRRIRELHRATKDLLIASSKGKRVIG
jgi:hypothetical protein